ncbi:DUF262 domain-containing protein [Limnothrix redekei]|uniref:DUF262 domain-containing protein n=1 Tax=Limnothrix redekei LRLZ20PSL1 TaxID=3112953 RepID=A0ABW7C732_9CYAN
MSNFRHVQKTVFTVGDFYGWGRDGSLILSPNFQRRSVWNPSEKSFLIDTVVRNLPIPVILIRTRTNIKNLKVEREVVDGQQRLRAVLSFVDPSLPMLDSKKDGFLVKKIHNDQIAGKLFSELPNSIKQSILDYQFSVDILPSDTEDSEVLRIFARMNSTGVSLNSQELRNAQYHGAFKQSVYQLAYEQLNRWRKWGLFSESEIARMREVEEVSDILQSIILGKITRKDQKSLNQTYEDYDEIFPHQDLFENRFRLIMDEIDDEFGELIKHTFVCKTASWFYPFFLFCYDTKFGLESQLSTSKSRTSLSGLRDHLEQANVIYDNKQYSAEVAKSLRGATTTADSRRVRFEFLKENLK